MKTEFGKWLMDIAKYMVTALLLSTIFEDMNEPLILYVVLILTPIILGYGLYWVNEGKKEEKSKNKKNEYINSCRIYFANSHRRYFIF